MNVFASKILTLDDLMHVDTGIMREHLIAKNVAAEVAEKNLSISFSEINWKNFDSEYSSSYARYINDER